MVAVFLVVFLVRHRKSVVAKPFLLPSSATRVFASSQDGQSSLSF